MNFKEYLNEIAEPRKPSSKVTYASTKMSRGTIKETPAVKYTWTTKLGNVVKIYFRKDLQEDGSYEVIFYVNDVLDDTASRTENSIRDPEILPGVIHTVLEKADALKAKVLRFSSWQDKDSTKVIRGLRYEHLKEPLLQQLHHIQSVIANHQPKELPLSDTHKSLVARGLIKATVKYDFNSPAWLNALKRLESNIQNNQRVEDDYHGLVSANSNNQFQVLNLDLTEFLKLLKAYHNAIESNTERGFLDNRNQRANVYEKLVDRYVPKDKWKVEKRGMGSFTLTRI